MQNKGKFYLTTAIVYASGKPHFGNTYEIIMADAFARFKRLYGYDVYMLTGTDEHGLKIETRAKDAGLTPKQFVDEKVGDIKQLWDFLGASYDGFIRTTDKHHEEAVQAIFRKFTEQGDIYKTEYEGWYCTPCESFVTESQLVDGKCPDCGRPVVKAKEEAYNFRMSAYADRLMKYIDEHPEFIEPESRKKEMVNNFLKAGLQDLCVSRTSFTWGVPVLDDPKHVVYVWLDALTNYITALGYNPNNETQPELFNKNWPADVHIIGKDILRFHTIYWPIFLMALDLPLPKKVFGHPWFNFGEDKMSKSRGNVIYADDLAEKIGVDGVRYYALSEMPYASDGSITYESVIGKYNTDLANNLGNLVSRTLAMNEKYFSSVVQASDINEDIDNELIAATKIAAEKALKYAEEYHIADALSEIFAMLRRANKYIDETTPWVLAKDEEKKGRLGTVLYNLLETIRIGAVLLQPYMPATAEEILNRLSTEKKSFDDLAFGALEVGAVTKNGAPLFVRLDEKKIYEEFEAESKKQMEEAKKAAESYLAPEKPEAMPEISIDRFAEIELRSAKIVECEKVAKSKKLLKCQVDLGYEKRQVLSGIGQFYKPEELIGKKVILVANLAPATLCGERSEGMILASGEKEIRVVFLSDDTPLGEKIR